MGIASVSQALASGRLRALRAALLTVLVLATPAAAKRKILALHGGGGSAKSMSDNTADLRTALGSEYEWVYASKAGNDDTQENWWDDPSGGKDEPTTDRDWASGMVTALNAIVQEQGPFYGIAGYSQGAAAVPVYLAQVPANTFQMAVMFCGYLPTTHQGLVDRINEQSPFNNTPALSWMGTADNIISNSMSEAQARKFTQPLVLKSQGAGHIPPCSSDGTFEDIVTFIKDPQTTALPRGVDDATLRTGGGCEASKKVWPLLLLALIVIIPTCIIVYCCCCKKKTV